MSAVCTAVEHCLTFKIPCWIKHTRRAMCLLRSRKCFENIGGFELLEAQLDCQLTSPHDFIAAASKRHELCLCSAQRNNLRKSMKSQSFACYFCHQPSWNRQKLEFYRVHEARDPATTPCELSPCDANEIYEHHFGIGKMYWRRLWHVSSHTAHREAKLRYCVDSHVEKLTNQSSVGMHNNIVQHVGIGIESRSEPEFNGSLHAFALVMPYLTKRRSM